MSCKWEWNFERVLYIGWGFTLLDIAFITAQGLTSKLLHDNDFASIGYVSIGIIYLTYSMFSFISKPIVDKLGNRYALALGCFFEAFHMVALVVAAMRKENPLNETLQNMFGFISFLICLCAFIAGIGTSLLWVSHGRYVTLCANDSNKGLFNAVFWVFMMLCQVVGNLLSATVIEKVKQSTFFIGFTILAVIAATWMLGLPTPKPHPGQIVDESVKASITENKLIEIEDEKQMELGKEQRQGSVYPSNPPTKAEDGEFMRMMKFIITPRWMKFVPIIFFSGISMAMYAALLIPMLSRTMPTIDEDPQFTDPRKTSLASFAMIGMGAGEVIGSLSNGKLNDKCGVRVYLWICVTELTLAYTMMLWYNERDTFTMAAAVATTFCWGLHDSGITNFFLCICGFQFSGSTLPFSALRFVQALAIGSFALIESQIKTVAQHRIYFICCYCFAMFGYMLFFFTFDLKGAKVDKNNKVSADTSTVEMKNVTDICE